MNNIKIFILLFIYILVCGFSLPAPFEAKKGNKLFKKGEYEEAGARYEQALKKSPDSAKLHYNLGTSFYKQGKYKEAEHEFRKALGNLPVGPPKSPLKGGLEIPSSNNESQISGIADGSAKPTNQLTSQQANKLTKSDLFQANAHYNLGNTFFQQQGFDDAIKQYERTLKINPEDEDAKFNLELAKKMKQQQQQQQQKQDKKDQKDKKDQQKSKDQKDKGKGDKGDQDKQKDQQQGDDKKDQQQQKGADDQKKEQQQKAAAKKRYMSKEDAERLLDALKEEQKGIHLGEKKKRRKKTPVEKDW
ncbi:tetratricopeptide repeat protein [Candidatus Margulisiibacteriota bacterium]